MYLRHASHGMSSTMIPSYLHKDHFVISAIFYASGILGPAIGYLIGGYLLTIYTDIWEDNP